jgi:hypothetical protein
LPQDTFQPLWSVLQESQAYLRKRHYPPEPMTEQRWSTQPTLPRLSSFLILLEPEQ